MNCIFCSVFNQEKYVDMFFLLLSSIFIYGNLDYNTNILVYTSTPFMNKIIQSKLFNDEKIKFEINDTYNNIDKACKARLDLFNLPSITNYNKILYLDTDILVKDHINKVFDVCEEDVLYVLEEGTIDSDNDYWGKTLFGNEINNYDDKSAFTSGILLFNNCEKIKDLFYQINKDIINRPYNFSCYDQPYIIYNAFKYNLYNNKILQKLVVNNDNNIHSDKVIHHFPGGPGIYEHKINAMTIFLNNIQKHTLNITQELFQTNMDTSVLNMHMLTSEYKYEFYNNAVIIIFLLIIQILIYQI
jgi:alpha-N-acetylglucosamine transferase